MRKRNITVIVCAMAFMAAQLAQAQLTWDANGTGAGQSNGGGAWLGANLWWNGTANQSWVSGSDAIFAGTATAAGSVTLASPTTVNSLTLNPSFTGTYTLGTAGQTITLNNGITMNSGAGAVTIISPVALAAAQVWTNATANTVTANGGVNLASYNLTLDGSGNFAFHSTANIITGSGGITKNGAGTLTLGAGGTTPVHNYTGPTIINGGTVMTFGDSNTAPGNFTLNNGLLTDYFQATTSFTGGLGTGNNQIQLAGGTCGFGGGNGNSTWRIGAAGSTLQWDSTYFTPSTLQLMTPPDNRGPSTYGTVTLDNALDLNGAVRTIYVLGASSGNPIGVRGIINRAISGTGTASSLTKTGDGCLVLGGNNTYGGSTTISAGIVDFGGITLGFGSGRDITASAGVIIMRTALNNAFLNRLVETSNEIGLFTGTTANNLDFSSSTGANLPNAFLGNWAGNGAKSEYSGTLTPASDNYRLGAKYSNGLLGIVGANKLTGTQGLIVGGTGASGIRVEVAAAQNFTGDTIVNTGARLSLGNNLALQNSVFDVGAAGGNFSLAAGTNAGKITGETATPSPTFGGLKGSRNLLSVFSATGGNNETLLAATAITGFTLNVGTGKTLTYSGAIGGFGTGGASTLTKIGDGTQILSGNNTYSGATTISAGILQLGAGGTSGTLGSGAVQNDATLVFNRSDTFTVANLMAGSGQLEKAGSGTQILTAANTYSGSTTISGGSLIGMVGGGCENSDLTISNIVGCTLGVAITDSTKQWTCKSLTTAGTSSKLAFSFTTAPSLTLAPLNVIGDLTFTGIPSITVDPAYLVSGQSYPLILVSGTAPSGEPPVTIGNGLTGTATWTGNTLWLNVGGTSTSALPLVWKTSTAGIWDTSTLNWNDSTMPTPNTVAYSEGLLVGDSVVFDDTVSANTVVTLSTTVKPSSVTVDNSVRDYTISGAGSISGITGLTKSGTKALTLSTPNAFIGPVDLAGGTLKLGNASALGAGTLTIAGGTTLDSTVANLVLTGGNPHNWTGNFTFTGSQNLTFGSGAVMLSGNPQVTVGANTLTVVGPISGSGISLSKAGNGTLVISGANTYTGGTTLNGGTLTAGANANLGADGSTITFAGNATLATVHSAYPVFAKGVAVNSGVTASLNPGSQFYKMTFTGPLSGNGTLDFNTGAGGAGSDLTFSSDANTFTGKVVITMSGNAGGGLTVNSLGDGANPIQLKGNANPSIFKLGTGTASPLLFNSRRIELNGTLAGGGTIENNNATVGNTIAINTDLLVSATGNKTLTLGGSNAGANTFAGKIVDGTGAVISLIKAGTGKWTLSGANTFTGTTTVSDGTLVLAAGTCLSDTAALSIASGKVVQIGTGVKEKVGSLKLNNVTQAAGIYGSTTSAAPPANRSAYFSGTGLLYVGVDLPPAGTFIRII